MRHKVKVIPKKEILANRSDAYEFIDFDKQEPCEYLKEVGCIKDICSCNTGPKQEITLEEVFNEEKRQGVKELIDKHKLYPMTPEESYKEETLRDKLESLVVQWHQRQEHYVDVAYKHVDDAHNNRKFTYKAMATRDCWKELLTLLNSHKDEQ